MRAPMVPPTYAIWAGQLMGLNRSTNSVVNAVVIWTLVLFVYCFIASVLPVWTLLQPRDYINSLELFLALGLLVVGIGVASLPCRTLEQAIQWVDYWQGWGGMIASEFLPGRNLIFPSHLMHRIRSTRETW